MAIPIPSLGERRGKQIVYTIEECTSCNIKTKRPFQLRDHVYKEAGECPKCKGKIIISMIYSEPVKPS